MFLHAEDFVFDTPTSERDSTASGLKVTAKRYTPHASANRNENTSHNDKGLTLLFAHCIGAHKELWEHTIETICRSLDGRGHGMTVREAWAFDWQTHGDAGVCNRDALNRRPTPGVSIYDWAATIAAFVRSDIMKGHRIVPIGHSAGAGTMMLTTKWFPPEKLPYTALILVEPTIVAKELFEAHIEDRMTEMNFAVSATAARRDSWASRAEALVWLGKRFPWNAWDRRILEKYTEYGLYEIPESAGAVKLKCEKAQEAASFTETEGHFESAVLMATVCKAIPVHIIWGDNPTLVPAEIQESLSDRSIGRTTASVRYVEDAGHMVLQEKPDGLAEAICEVLRTVNIKALDAKL